MSWFDQIKAVLPGYYPASQPGDVVGYLRGSPSHAVWRLMQQGDRPRHQMIILGSVEPTRDEWIAAGVAQRLGEVQTIRIDMLNGFIILYGGFMYRPWGSIHFADADALTNGFPSSLNDWKRNYRPPRH
jgi:hypothetical protein